MPFAMLMRMARATDRWQQIGELAVKVTARVAARLGTDIQTVIGRETGAVEKPSEEAAPVSPDAQEGALGHGDTGGDSHAARSFAEDRIALSYCWMR